MFLFDDTAVNCWGEAAGEEQEPAVFVDGEKMSARRGLPRRNVRNSMFRFGRCRLGDRHVLELAGEGAKLTYVDAKTCPNRRRLGVENPLWQLDGAVVTPFPSRFGGPYGAKQILLAPGKALVLDAVLTDVSVCYADRPAQMRIVEHEAGEFAENRLLALKLGLGQFAAVSTRTDDREADVHGRFDTRVCARAG
jgi:hypothetical protein